MKRHLLSMVAALLGLVVAGGADSGTRSESLTLTFGDTTSRAELLLPANVQSAPLVLLIQGTGPEDLNGSFVTYGQTVQGSLGQLAASLARQGFAVMRFDKRYAAQTLSPLTAQGAQEKYDQLGMKDLLSDARTALNTARSHLGVDGQKVFIYGWSEGTVIAAALAQEPGVKGLILQGPVVESYATTFASQFEQVGMTYLLPYARGGNIDLQGVMAALTGPGSSLAKMQATLLLSRDSTPQHPKLATVLDTNDDGSLNLRTEVLPRIAGFYDTLAAQSPLYAPASTLPTLGQAAPTLKVPVLIVQGENDGNVNVRYARQLNTALARAGNRDHTLKVYPGLGHSLGLAPSITQDALAPMQVPPMNDIATWLKAH
ncbi:lysophospholipase (plasmid) [Deinococcus sp. KNUC1210]|uniref:alpha/beta hydrolase family protein n=1 Tax=Deinococcus sp. KNUC1210 TaxID=2917691 RepID=UPI001EEF871B|nr:alpha/beta fold hydrolase [Deinococcus sp. KNUC1210]ULH18244.1 lysophospholipase [Deinococcus sp. KNUC1210]